MVLSALAAETDVVLLFCWRCPMHRRVGQQRTASVDGHDLRRQEDSSAAAARSSAWLNRAENHEEPGSASASMPGRRSSLLWRHAVTEPQRTGIVTAYWFPHDFARIVRGNGRRTS